MRQPGKQIAALDIRRFCAATHHIGVQGAIDSIRSGKVESIAKARNHVTEALKNGKEVAIKATKPYGCDTTSKFAVANLVRWRKPEARPRARLFA